MVQVNSYYTCSNLLAAPLVYATSSQNRQVVLAKLCSRPLCTVRKSPGRSLNRALSGGPFIQKQCNASCSTKLHSTHAATSATQHCQNTTTILPLHRIHRDLQKHNAHFAEGTNSVLPVLNVCTDLGKRYRTREATQRLPRTARPGQSTEQVRPWQVAVAQASAKLMKIRLQLS